MHCEIGLVVATRSFAGTLFDGTPAEITVNFGLPGEWTQGVSGDWACPYQILGIGDDRIELIRGIDSVQALYLAMAFVGSKLANHMCRNELDLAELNFGFPPLPVVTDIML